MNRSAFDRARDEWNSEVDNEAARLVREGTPPFDAMQRAVEIISRRRRNDTLRGTRAANPETSNG